MSDYQHGAYGIIQAAGTKTARGSQSAMVYIGTAPVNTVAGGGANVNKPIVINNMAEARKYFGYSDDWAKYTLCEAMYVHFELNSVGPLILINMLDPAKHKSDEVSTVSLTPVNGRLTIPNAGDIILDSVNVGAHEKGVDYDIAYNTGKNTITITERVQGKFGSEAISVSYNSVDPSLLTDEEFIGSTDNAGLNTGVYTVKNVYLKTGYIPSFLLAPGFSCVPAIHSGMHNAGKKINGHWHAYIMADIPIVDADGNAISLANAASWKNANGYNHENETVYFPMAEGANGRKYHLSVLAAANLQQLLVDQEGIPYKTASNTECGMITNLYMGADNAGRVFDDEVINNMLNKHGIASAAFVGGRWAIWGCHSADYDEDNGDQINVSETNHMMLYYVSNDFQHRRMGDVDKPMTANDLKAIVAEEQERLDALVKIGALTYGECFVIANSDATSDIMNGDFKFSFNLTTTPLAKSLTAVVNWTEDGYDVYFEAIMSAA